MITISTITAIIIPIILIVIITMISDSRCQPGLTVVDLFAMSALGGARDLCPAKPAESTILFCQMLQRLYIHI